MKILVISSNLIGDTILSTCVIEHFAFIYPKATFTFVIGPTSGQIYEHFPSKENIILIKKKKFNFHWIDMYLAIKKTKWEVIIDLRSSLISFFLKSKKRYIFKKDKSLSHLNQLKKSYNLKNSNLFIHTSKEEGDNVKILINKKYQYVVIFPGGNWKPKIYPTDCYNKLIFMLNNEFQNLRFVIVGSISEKKLYLDKIKKDLPKDIFIDLMGKTLTYTSAYMKKSKLFIGNHSGLMHLSVASGLTTIGLFGPTNDKIYGHHSSKSFVIRTRDTYESIVKKPIDSEKSYMLSIKPEEIVRFVKKNKLL